MSESEFHEVLRAAAIKSARYTYDLSILIPDNGPDTASQWLIDAVEQATGTPIQRTPLPSGGFAKINLARVRTHLRQWGALQNSR